MTVLYGKVYISIILFSLFERNRRDSVESGRDLLNPLRVCRNSEETSISIHRKLNFLFYCFTDSLSIPFFIMPSTMRIEHRQTELHYSRMFNFQHYETIEWVVNMLLCRSVSSMLRRDSFACRGVPYLVNKLRCLST